MKTYKLLNTVIGWSVFLIAAVVYLLTIEPTASFWDCGEFITSAYKLEVGHPPGAPFFMIIGRIFTLFAGDNVEMVPVMINSLSALASAFTILFLFWTITHIAKKTLVKNGNEITTPQMTAIFGSALVGALAYTFSDTFWFSAVEGEVYAFSSLFTALVFWAILKWENVANEKHANRWLIFIAYLMGLSIGVHLLNLLAIPAIVFIYYFKKYNVSKKGIIYTSLVAVAILAAIQYGIIPGLIKVASKFELVFVNSFGMGFNSGVIVYLLLLITSLVGAIYYTSQKPNALLATITSTLGLTLLGVPLIGGNILLGIIILGAMGYSFYKLAEKNRDVLNTIVLAGAVIFIGYSSFAMIIIRSLADPPMDQNNPDNFFSLLSYLNREQYGDRPLFYGQYYNTEVTGYEETEPVYIPLNGKYEAIDHKIKREFNKKQLTFFPRMYSDQRSPNHVEGYKIWTGIPANSDRKPTFRHNLTFFFRYQIGFMYLRYFMWNFAGRQNDIQGHGNSIHGNWISGIKAIDEMRLGNQDNLPDELANNKGRNKYYMLPLLLGILGLIFLFNQNKKDFTVLILLFFFTGLAIILYTNQPPFQPRERDYAYAGSFYAYAIFIGFGVMFLYDLLKDKISPILAAGGVTVASLLAVPTIMASENWDDHDRSECYTARDFAYNYLNSCTKNAILFTNGDNDTFPLWYAQEVEGIRTDVRVINLSYLNTDWYIDQAKRRVYDSPPVPFSMTHEQYRQGKRDIVYVRENENLKKEYTDLKQLIDFIASDDMKTKLRSQGGEPLDYIPTKNVKLTVDKQKIIENNVVQERYLPEVLPEIRFELSRSYIRKNELLVLDLLSSANWKRPIYFAITVGHDSYVNLSDYFMLEGLAYRVVPIRTKNQDGQTGRVASDIMYDKLMNEFKWGGIDNPDVYLNENNRRMVMNFRNNFARLATQLTKEGKQDSAIKVLDRCTELMPHQRVPYNYYNLLIAQAYYDAKAYKKGNEIVKILVQVTDDKLEYYFSLEEHAKALQDDIQREGAILQEIIRQYQIRSQKKDKEIDDLIKQVMSKYSSQ